jgi:hypothetical protein
MYTVINKLKIHEITQFNNCSDFLEYMKLFNQEIYLYGCVTECIIESNSIISIKDTTLRFSFYIIGLNQLEIEYFKLIYTTNQ